MNDSCQIKDFHILNISGDIESDHYSDPFRRPSNYANYGLITPT